jgi:hypothetical protein
MFQDVAVNDQSFTVKYPHLDLEQQTFTTHIQSKGAAKTALRNKQPVEITQYSICTLHLDFGSFSVQCNFPFPVDSKLTKVRVSRAQGWLEVVAPLVTPSKRGRFISDPFPIIPGPDGKIYNLFLPHVDFRTLPKLDEMQLYSSIDAPHSIPTHLMSMFTNREETDPGGTGSLAKIKLMIHALLFPKHKVIRIMAPHYIPLLTFFVKGIYLNHNSGTVVGEGYVLPMKYTVNNPPSSVAVTEFNVGQPEMTWLHEVLPGMVEQGRDWEHSSDCEYKRGEVPKKQFTPYCTCGQVRLGEVFGDIVDLKTYSPMVTKVAISPLFSAPYVQPTRRELNMQPETEQNDGSSERPKCKVCAKEAPQKCGKCKKVSYCSRQCQAEDWTEHKKTCRKRMT